MHPARRENLVAAVRAGLGMTTIERSSHSAGAPSPFDVRCSATLARDTPGEGRCQLFAGHDGPHAVMFARCGKRTVRNWSSRDPGAATDSGALQRPWMFGYPSPAWFETELAPERTG